jgi:hypothetical protein
MGNGSVERPVSWSRDGLREGECSMGEESVARFRQVCAASKEIADSFRVFPWPQSKVGAELSRGRPGGASRNDRDTW